MNYLARAFAEPSGKPSAHRLAMAGTLVTIMGTWTYVSIAKQALQTLDPTLAVIVLGALGIQAWKRGKEQTTETNKP